MSTVKIVLQICVAVAYRCGEVFCRSGCGHPADAPDRLHQPKVGYSTSPLTCHMEVTGGTTFESEGSLGRTGLTQASFGTTQTLPHT
jgi:hypothetical protein